MEILAETLDIVGKIMVSYTALMVHHRVRKEHKIDEKVFKDMKSEQIIGLLGILFMIAAYIILII